MPSRHVARATRGLVAVLLMALSAVAQPAGAAERVGYALLAVRADGRPVGYDPCRPIHYVVNPTEAPPGGSPRLIESAIETVAAASGYRFIFDGSSAERPPTAVVERDIFQPERYGEGWAPVLIAWSTPRELPRLAGATLGLGGSRAVASTYVTGVISLDAPGLAWRLTRTEGHAYVRAVIEHELGHLLGLAHVSDPDQLMYPIIGDRLGLGPGDRRGLAELGRSPCGS